MGRIWIPPITQKEKDELDAWWAEELARKKARPSWPPVWKPAKRNPRWRKK